jgi:hypothetical protein
MEGRSDELAETAGIAENTPIAKTNKRVMAPKGAKGFLELPADATIIRSLVALEG